MRMKGRKDWYSIFGAIFAVLVLLACSAPMVLWLLHNQPG